MFYISLSGAGITAQKLENFFQALIISKLLCPASDSNKIRDSVNEEHDGKKLFSYDNWLRLDYYLGKTTAAQPHKC